MNITSIHNESCRKQQRLSLAAQIIELHRRDWKHTKISRVFSSLF